MKLIPQIDFDIPEHLKGRNDKRVIAHYSRWYGFKEVMKLIENKVFHPFIDKVYKFSDIKKAHKTIEDRNQFGKVVLIPWESIKNIYLFV